MCWIIYINIIIKILLNLDHSDKVKQIKNLLQNRTAKTCWIHVYSHTNDNPNMDPAITTKNIQKRQIIYGKYGEQRAEHFIEGNQIVDQLTANSTKLSDLQASLYNKYQNKYMIKSTRKRATNISDFKGVIDSKIRKTLKRKLEVNMEIKYLKKTNIKYGINIQISAVKVTLLLKIKNIYLKVTENI